MKELSKNIILTESQLEADRLINIHKIVILSGGPGTGKTSAVKNILDKAHLKGKSICQCAPTGKAAKRMIEATGYPAQTIHVTLGCSMHKGQFIFGHNEQNPLPVDYLIIDEFSMADNYLVSCLLRAVDPQRTHVLIVGDPGQLPSVGPGSVLYDLLSCEAIPRVELNTIHRNSGYIVEACQRIHQGKDYDLHSKLDLEADNPINLIHVERKDQESTSAAIVKIVNELIPEKGFDPMWDVQVLSPTNTKTDLSCEGLNVVLQNVLNPGDCEKGFKFRAGDKVINTKNEKVKKTDNRDSFIVNGDMGKVVDVGKKKLIVEFFEPRREVALSKASNNLTLAYAVTCHKFQGSESPVVVIPVDKAFSYFCDRRWLYTAISRGKKIVITVGNFASISKMTANIRKLDRSTRLTQKINDLLESGNLGIEVHGDGYYMPGNSVPVVNIEDELDFDI